MSRNNLIHANGLNVNGTVRGRSYCYKCSIVTNVEVLLHSLVDKYFHYELIQ